jgi:hypothetical protein
MSQFIRGCAYCPFLSEVLACIAQQHEYPAKAVGVGGTLPQGSERSARPVKSPVIKSLTGISGRGSDGAFAWGALDRILEDERIAIEGIAGTSASAMNAAVTCGGNAGSASTGSFWKAVADAGAWSMMQPSIG